ncbi:MAG: pectin methylesterase [Clostridia bacterium]|nr:pectin methylesterase [Clostridia bacterium]
MLTITIQPGDHALQNAINSLPQDTSPAVIRLMPGEYREKVELRRANVTLEGAGAESTRIVWDDAASRPHPDGLNIGTFRSYTLLVLANGCTLRGLTVENAARPREEVGQCVALFADGDLFTCEDCTLLSAQDTLFTAPLPPKEALKNGFLGPTQLLPRRPQRHTYRRCVIKGDVDFIFGGAAAWFEDCDIVSINAYTDGRIPGGYATAASTPEGQKYGYVFMNCRFLAGENVGDATMYLGRPWREFAKTVLLRCFIDPHIKPEGWNDWGKAQFPETGFYAEYACTGPGSDGERVPYAHHLTDAQAAEYTYENFMNSL